MKAESIIVTILIICIFLSFYFAYLSFQETDESLKKQLVTLSAYSLIAGIVLMACMTIYLSLKRAFPKMEISLKRSKEAEGNENT